MAMAVVVTPAAAPAVWNPVARELGEQFWNGHDAKSSVRGERIRRVCAESAARGNAPIFAVDFPGKATGSKYYLVASYGKFRDWLRETPDAKKMAYDVLRGEDPCKFYMDVDVPTAYNPGLTPADVYRRLTMYVTKIGELTGRPDLCERVFISDSTRASKISLHVVLPDLVLLNPYHCGALVRRTRVALTDTHGAAATYIKDKHKEHRGSGAMIDVSVPAVDEAVYTSLRCFRILGNRKNNSSAGPLRMSDLSTGEFDDPLRASILQWIGADVPIFSCMELDGSVPRSTNKKLYTGAGAAGSASAAAGASAAAAAAASPGAAAAASSVLAEFWRSTYDFDKMWDMVCDTGVARKFQMVVNGRHWQLREYASAQALRDDVFRANPSELHVGAEAAGRNPNLMIDVDTNDYMSDGDRPCCGGQKKVCALCWPVVEFAQLVITELLAYYGVARPTFLFSGGKGIHAWAPRTCEAAREIALDTDPTTVTTLLAGFDDLRTHNDAGKTACAMAVLPDDASVRRWKVFLVRDMKRGAEFARLAHQTCDRTAIFRMLSPVVDEEVTLKRSTHTIKAPFSLHSNGRQEWLLETPADMPPYIEARAVPSAPSSAAAAAAAAAAGAGAADSAAATCRNVIIQSTLCDDIEKAMVTNEWASIKTSSSSRTPGRKRGNAALIEHFDDSGGNVWLYFTKFRTGKIFGIARMMTKPNAPPAGYWENPQAYGGTFKISWISTTTMDMPVSLRGRYILDTDVVSATCAREILQCAMPSTTADRDVVGLAQAQVLRHAL